MLYHGEKLGRSVPAPAYGTDADRRFLRCLPLTHAQLFGVLDSGNLPVCFYFPHIRNIEEFSRLLQAGELPVIRQALADSALAQDHLLAGESQWAYSPDGLNHYSHLLLFEDLRGDSV
jgi:hypothetical protein